MSGRNIKNGNVNSSYTTANVSNWIFIMGNSTMKHVRGYKLSRKVENCKFYVKTFSGARSCVWRIT